MWSWSTYIKFKHENLNYKRYMELISCQNNKQNMFYKCSTLFINKHLVVCKSKTPLTNWCRAEQSQLNSPLPAAVDKTMTAKELNGGQQWIQVQMVACLPPSRPWFWLEWMYAFKLLQECAKRRVILFS